LPYGAAVRLVFARARTCVRAYTRVRACTGAGAYARAYAQASIAHYGSQNLVDIVAQRLRGCETTGHRVKHLGR